MHETRTDSIAPSSDVNGYDLQGRFTPGTDISRPDVEEIKHNAYFLYLNSAAVDGNDLEHWLLAEKQLEEKFGPRMARF